MSKSYFNRDKLPRLKVSILDISGNILTTRASTMKLRATGDCLERLKGEDAEKAVVAKVTKGEAILFDKPSRRIVLAGAFEPNVARTGNLRIELWRKGTEDEESSLWMNKKGEPVALTLPLTISASNVPTSMSLICLEAPHITTSSTDGGNLTIQTQAGVSIHLCLEARGEDGAVLQPVDYTRSVCNLKLSTPMLQLKESFSVGELVHRPQGMPVPHEHLVFFPAFDAPQ